MNAAIEAMCIAWWGDTFGFGPRYNSDRRLMKRAALALADHFENVVAKTAPVSGPMVAHAIRMEVGDAE